MNLLVRMALGFLQLLMAVIIVLGFLIFFFSFVQDDERSLSPEADVKSEH